MHQRRLLAIGAAALVISGLLTVFTLSLIHI